MLQQKGDKMKKFLYTAIAALGVFCATNTYADFYAGAGYGLGFNGGSATLNNVKGDYKQSTFYSLNAGYVMPLPAFDIRGEIEYLRTRPAVKGQHARRLDALMGTLSAVIPVVPFLDPYVGFGLGYARFDHSNTQAWQYHMGIEYKFAETPFAVGAEYRYLKLTESCGNHNNYSRYHTNALLLKLKYTF